MRPEGPPSPFVGLRTFEDSERDVSFFFGRERERGLIEANLMASRLTVLYGQTGVGKSSLLRAGVAHHLRGIAKRNLEEHGEPELAVVVFDAWRGDPVEALRRACAEEVTRALGGTLPPPDAGEPLAEALRAWQQLLGGDLYVVLDQAEEYFLYHENESAAGTFRAEFPAVVTAPDLHVNFLLAIREDALAKLDAFKTVLPNVLGNYLRLDYLDRAAARAAIVEPIARYNQMVAEAETMELEPRLVDAVLEQVAAGKVDVRSAGRGAVNGGAAVGRIETPYLQLVMQRLWEEEHTLGSRALRLETLQRLGGAEHIVGDHVRRALSELTASDKDIAAAMFDHLVTPSGTKIAHGAGDLARYAGTEQPAVVSVLDKLGNDRIVRSVADGRANGARYEIFHDVLAQPVLAWKADHEVQREFAQQREEAERRHRRMLWIVAVAAVALAVMGAVTAFALAQRGEARSQARIAGARELAANAVSQLEVDPQRSLALGIESAHRARTSEVEDVLRQALISSRERAILPSRGPAHTAAFSPDGSLVVTTSDDGTARLWRRDGSPVHTLRHRKPVVAASFSPDGSLLLTASRDGSARVWQVTTGALVATLRHDGPVTSASFSRDGSLALTASDDGTARVWSTAGWTPVRVVREAGPVSSASLSSDGRRLVTVGSDPSRTNRRARVYALPSGRLLHQLRAKGVTTASFSPNGTLIVTGGVDHTAAIFDALTGKRLHLLADHLGVVTDALFGPGGRLVATTSTDGGTRVWNVQTGARIALMQGHTNIVIGASFSGDGRFLVTVSADDKARIWEAATGSPETVLRGHTDAVVDGSFSPDGRLVVTASSDGTARIWDPGTVPELSVLARFPDAVNTASYSPDGGLVLAGSDDGTARILADDGRVVRVLHHPAAVTSAVFSSDGKIVLTADATRTVRLWRAGGGELVRSVRNVSVGPLALSADGRSLAGPDVHGTMRIFDVATLSPLHALREGGPFVAASFGPDGTSLATAGRDGAARIWNLRSGNLVRTFEGHKDALTSVEFSRDGTMLVTSSRDHDARVWDVETGRSTLLHGHFGTIFDASFSPDGRFVVTAGPTTAGLWPSSTGSLLTYLRGYREPLTSASFSPDGTQILTSGRDGTVRTYTCELCGDVDALVAVAEARLAPAALGEPYRGNG